MSLSVRNCSLFSDFLPEIMILLLPQVPQEKAGHVIVIGGTEAKKKPAP
jgi:hypothetical protein